MSKILALVLMLAAVCCRTKESEPIISVEDLPIRLDLERLINDGFCVSVGYDYGNPSSCLFIRDNTKLNLNGQICRGLIYGRIDLGHTCFANEITFRTEDPQAMGVIKWFLKNPPVRQILPDVYITVVDSQELNIKFLGVVDSTNGESCFVDTSHSDSTGVTLSELYLPYRHFTITNEYALIRNSNVLYKKQQGKKVKVFETWHRSVTQAFRNDSLLVWINKYGEWPNMDSLVVFQLSELDSL